MENCVTPIIVSRRSRFRIDFRFIDNLFFKIWCKGRGIGDEENESGRVWLNMVVYGKVFVILRGGILL